MSAPIANAATNGTCPQCGVKFRCGMDVGDAECWCAALPPLSGLPAQSGEFAANCLCPACLRERLGLALASGQAAQS
ncbi:MAG: cysteine-rich CWC family protein [Sterolibacteriaceae bacterium]|uniref:cysteine-rich CWC family protein n=1 Tax=Sulfuritalea sp. TaxID=2480090 RepID=UPI001A499993|nr:cysteine-rich CWC family protein [Sterolibacteriaceae bacterium]MBN8476869.1 cysteine-rich CWC family protein [Sulfuritalea sp.]